MKYTLFLTIVLQRGKKDKRKQQCICVSARMEILIEFCKKVFFGRTSSGFFFFFVKNNKKYFDAADFFPAKNPLQSQTIGPEMIIFG